MGFSVDYSCSLFYRTQSASKKTTIFRSVNATLVTLSFITLLGVTIIIMCSLRNFSTPNLSFRAGIDFHRASIRGRIHSRKENYKEESFSGKWVYDQTYPLYNASNCPFVEPDLSCETNGRPDRAYTHLKWQPNEYSLPVFNASKTLSKLENMRVAFVGDSMGRTQWESLVCMLMEGVTDKQSVKKLKQDGNIKRISYLGAFFSNFNLTIEYYRAPFLVEKGTPLKGVSDRIKAAVRLDRLVSSKFKWQDAQVLVFNSAHWWTPKKIFDKDSYFEISGNINISMNIEDAYELALKTWATWIKQNVNPMKTRVFFRTYEPAHWSNDISPRSCSLHTNPIYPVSDLEGQFGKLSNILEKVVHEMKYNVTVLNITMSSGYRVDAHVGSWSTSPSILDCSHWCLPGVPDTWNELLLFLLDNSIHLD
ncbi:hypothetical protein SUGI_0037870 [Cryptomeria japonica]|nr:hypothetical protein SUGI_0037870 [Cryptomeria japonica]